MKKPTIRESYLNWRLFHAAVFKQLFDVQGLDIEMNNRPVDTEAIWAVGYYLISPELQVLPGINGLVVYCLPGGAIEIQHYVNDELTGTPPNLFHSSILANPSEENIELFCNCITNLLVKTKPAKANKTAAFTVVNENMVRYTTIIHADKPVQMLSQRLHTSEGAVIQYLTQMDEKLPVIGDIIEIKNNNYGKVIKKQNYH